MAALLPFQDVGAQFLAARPRALLADGMRCGKTPTTIRACDITGVMNVLVLCPAIARPNWVREFKRWSGRDAIAITSKADVTQLDFSAPLVLVCSYSLLIDLKVYEALRRVWGLVVLDESHFLKNEDSKRTDAAYKLAIAARYAWCLTGTPMPNNASELYPMLVAFGATKLSLRAFVDRYCTVVHPELDRRITGNKPDALSELKEQLAPLVLRRTLAQVAPEMPAVRWENIAVEPGIVAVALLQGSTQDQKQDMDVKAFAKRAAAEEKRLVAAWADAQEQIELIEPDAVKDFRRYVGMQKVEPIADLVCDEWNAMPQPLVIFGWHRDVLRGLAFLLEGRGLKIGVIDGRTPPGEKERLQQLFRDGEISHLACQIVAAGTAIDLSTSDEALFIEADWTPGNNSQAAFRVVSQFKTRPVRVRFASVAGSIDEAIMRSAARKARMEAEVFS